MLDTLAPRLQRKCLTTLRRICSHQTLLPGSLQIPLCYNRSDIPLYRSEYADLWRGEHQGCHVAAKVLRVNSTSHFDKITSVGVPTVCRKACVNKLTPAHIEVLQGSFDVESSLPSERTATVGSDHDRLPVRDGMGVDGEREYYRVHQVARGCESVRTCGV